MKFKLFFAKYGFWLVVGGLIIGVYGYGIWYRHQMMNASSMVINRLFPQLAFLENIPGVGDFLENIKTAFNSESTFEAMKDSEVYQMMSLPEKFRFNLAFLTKKTMPLAIIAIVLIALILRTKFSATIDIYTAERQAALDAARNINPVVVEAKIINAGDEETEQVNSSITNEEAILLEQTESPVLEVENLSELDSDSMDVF